MAKRCFHLKPSRMAKIIHGLGFILMSSILYVLLIFWLWLVCVVLTWTSYLYFRSQQQQIRQFEYLADQDWSLYDVHQQQLKRVQINKIIDHHLYIVIYFQNRQAHVVIWQDQLSRIEWKNLKILAKLY